MLPSVGLRGPGSTVTHSFGLIGVRFVRGLRGVGASEMDVRKAVEAIPREAFIPDVIWVHRGDGWSVPVRRGEQPERWAELAGCGDSIVIQMDDGKAIEKGAWPTSSSTAPDGMVTMINALDLRAGMRVLEVGTGSGFNAAVLAYLLGTGNVTTIEVDGALADHARKALVQAGCPVCVIAGDGAEGDAPGAPLVRSEGSARVHIVPISLAVASEPVGVIV